MDPMILVWIGRHTKEINQFYLFLLFVGVVGLMSIFVHFHGSAAWARRILIEKQNNKKWETLIIIGWASAVGHGRHCPINISASTGHVDSLLLSPRHRHQVLSRSFFIFYFYVWSYSSPSPLHPHSLVYSSFSSPYPDILPNHNQIFTASQLFPASLYVGALYFYLPLSYTCCYTHVSEVLPFWWINDWNLFCHSLLKIDRAINACFR